MYLHQKEGWKSTICRCFYGSQIQIKSLGMKTLTDYKWIRPMFYSSSYWFRPLIPDLPFPRPPPDCGARPRISWAESIDTCHSDNWVTWVIEGDWGLRRHQQAPDHWPGIMSVFFTEDQTKLLAEARDEAFMVFSDLAEVSAQCCDLATAHHAEQSEKDVETLENFRSQIQNIRAVISRHQFKVVFFGRTSSGKSKFSDISSENTNFPKNILNGNLQHYL